MKRKVFLFCLLTWSLGTHAADNTAATTTTSTTTTTTNTAAGAGAMNSDTPGAACKSLVESAKNKNFDAFTKLSTGLPMNQKNMKNAKAGYQKMHSQYLDRLQDLTCGNEIIATDHAVVESESKGEKRLVPFVKMDQGWKFDMKTYQSFYHTEATGRGKGKGHM